MSSDERPPAKPQPKLPDPMKPQERRRNWLRRGSTAALTWEGQGGVKKESVIVPVSAEAYEGAIGPSALVGSLDRMIGIAAGTIEPTDEERTRMEETLRWDVARKLMHAADTEALRAALAAVSDPLARATLDLHEPVDMDYGASTLYCVGCDVDDFEGSAPYWPCGTVLLIADRSGVMVPEWMRQE